MSNLSIDASRIISKIADSKKKERTKLLLVSDQTFMKSEIERAEPRGWSTFSEYNNQIRLSVKNLYDLDVDLEIAIDLVRALVKKRRGLPINLKKTVRHVYHWYDDYLCRGSHLELSEEDYYKQVIEPTIFRSEKAVDQRRMEKYEQSHNLDREKWEKAFGKNAGENELRAKIESSRRGNIIIAESYYRELFHAGQNIGRVRIWPEEPDYGFKFMTNSKLELVTDSSHRRKLHYEMFGDVKFDSNDLSLIKDVIDNGTMSVLYGDTNVGKTFFAIDMAMHVALGKCWMGRRVDQGGVVYLAAEGGPNVKKRIAAYKKFHKLEGQDIPFALIVCPIDLLNPNTDTLPLIDLIKDVETKCGIPVKLVVIDTLARAISGADENSFADLSAFTGNVDRIRDATKAHVMAVHHTGKDASRGARGHSSLKGAIDSEIFIEDGKATLSKERDKEKGNVIPFKLHVVDLGNNQHGEPITSCVVLPADPGGHKRHLKPGTNAHKAFQSFESLVGSVGVASPGYLSFKDMKAVAEDEWKRSFIEEFYPDASKEKTALTAFRRVKEELIKSGHISNVGSFYGVL